MEEAQLVRGLRERRESAVAAFMERYRSLLYHCIGHFEQESSAREDLYQELVLYVLERLDADRFDPQKGSLGTWLYRVAWCRCVDLKRRQNARRGVMLTLPEDLPDQADESPGPGVAAGDEEVGTLVRAAFGTLEEQDRSLLELRYVEGMTLVQISGELGITVEQAKYRLKRASASMRKVLLQKVARQEAVE
jgi:RNA polymerase sigma-70 factor (ECF subfamily)